MLRLPRFSYLRPKTAREAATMAAELGDTAMLVAGGTDLFPNMKRRQFAPPVLIGLGGLNGLADVRGEAQTGLEVGALVTLADASAESRIAATHPGYQEACALVSSPPLRNQGTIGGNLLVDPRCNYYNQTQEWRRAIGYCMKKDGDICLVAPSSHRCWAVSSSDTAPLAIALGARVRLAGPDGERELPLEALYRDDGIDYLAKQPFEVVTHLLLPPTAKMGSAYVKLRRRGSIDFPIAGAGVALRLEGDTVESCRIVLTAAGSRPVAAAAAGAAMRGKRLDEALITEAARLAAGPAKPLDNADLNHFWRKRMVPVIVEEAIKRAARRCRQSAA